MILTTEHEMKINSSTTYLGCLKGTDLRRTIIVVFLYCMQIIGGTTLRSSATYFFEQAGLPTAQAFNMAIGTYVISYVGVIVSVCALLYPGFSCFINANRSFARSGSASLTLADERSSSGAFTLTPPSTSPLGEWVSPLYKAVFRGPLPLYSWSMALFAMCA